MNTLTLMMIVRRTSSEPQTMDLARHLAHCLRGGEIVALSGELGAGKTCFVRGLAQGLGARGDEVSSPTFVICQEYPVAKGLTLAHLDAYRIEGDDDLDTIGWDELTDSDDTILAVEWPERITASRFPIDRVVYVRIEPASEFDRVFRFEIPESISYRFQSIRPSTRKCPSCAENVSTDEHWFPFCSERCRLADLGEWFNEKYRVSRPIVSDDLTD